jgi:hypothetical protein
MKVFFGRCTSKFQKVVVPVRLIELGFQKLIFGNSIGIKQSESHQGYQITSGRILSIIIFIADKHQVQRGVGVDEIGPAFF